MENRNVRRGGGGERIRDIERDRERRGEKGRERGRQTDRQTDSESPVNNRNQNPVVSVTYSTGLIIFTVSLIQQC